MDLRTFFRPYPILFSFSFCRTNVLLDLACNSTLEKRRFDKYVKYGMYVKRKDGPELYEKYLREGPSPKVTKDWFIKMLNRSLGLRNQGS